MKAAGDAPPVKKVSCPLVRFQDVLLCGGLGLATLWFSRLSYPEYNICVYGMYISKYTYVYRERKRERVCVCERKTFRVELSGPRLLK